MDAEPRILILENIPSDAELIEIHLRKSSLRFSSRRVATKEYFLKTLLDFTPDVVIADYAVPRLDGVSALKLAREVTPGIPWIIVCAPMGSAPCRS